MKQNHTTEPWEVVILHLKEKAWILDLTYEDIARQSSLAPSTVKRVMNLKYCPSLRVFMAMARVVGMRITDTY